eukprot:TRINITY_DN2225_c0_g2_i5.p2 TRINITY_DN2225_c0_g2~~TRINITY_DN2225_c0_g2_i5.p2  ORF type:complete len:215 (+),score=-22.67 TRINITY_DN2225_c0_g2_i5:65-646(+)
MRFMQLKMHKSAAKSMVTAIIQSVNFSLFGYVQQMFLHTNTMDHCNTLQLENFQIKYQLNFCKLNSFSSKLALQIFEKTLNVVRMQSLQLSFIELYSESYILFNFTCFISKGNSYCTVQSWVIKINRNVEAGKQQTFSLVEGKNEKIYLKKNIIQYIIQLCKIILGIYFKQLKIRNNLDRLFNRFNMIKVSHC